MKRKRGHAKQSQPNMLAFSMTQACLAAGVSRHVLRAAIASGELKAKRLAQRLVIKRVDLELWLDNLDDARQTGAR